MAAYVIVNIEVLDPERYAEYVKIAPDIVAKFGGKYLARGGRAEVLEGNWAARRVVLLEFEAYDDVKRWWTSQEYKNAKALRQSATNSDMLIVEGL